MQVVIEVVLLNPALVADLLHQVLELVGLKVQPDIDYWDTRRLLIFHWLFGSLRAHLANDVCHTLVRDRRPDPRHRRLRSLRLGAALTATRPH